MLTADFDRLILVPIKYLFGLYRETDCNLGVTVENLKDMIANQPAKLTFGTLFGNQFNPAITGVYIRNK